MIHLTELDEQLLFLFFPIHLFNFSHFQNTEFFISQLLNFFVQNGDPISNQIIKKSLLLVRFELRASNLKNTLNLVRRHVEATSALFFVIHKFLRAILSFHDPTKFYSAKIP